MTTLTIRATGTPTPQGSKKGFVNPNTGRAIIVDDNKKPLKAWRQDVRAAALDAIRTHPQPTAADQTWPYPLTGALQVSICFYMPRPKYHFGSGKNAHLLKPSAPAYHDKKPDGDKLTRAVFDALTEAGVYGDDAQVAIHHVEKRYITHGQAPGVLITVTPLATAAPVEDQAVLL